MRLHARDSVPCAFVLEKRQKIVLHIVKIHPVRRAFGVLIAGAKISRKPHRFREDETFRLESRRERFFFGDDDVVEHLLHRIALVGEDLCNLLVLHGFRALKVGAHLIRRPDRPRIFLEHRAFLFHLHETRSVRE